MEIERFTFSDWHGLSDQPMSPSRQGVRSLPDSHGANGNRVVLPEDGVVARNHNFWYGETQVLFELDLRVPSKQVTALIGPSGCGKSTFIRNINRMNELIPNSRADGEILIQGDSIYAPDLHVMSLRRRVGMIFQKSNPFPKSVFENVAYPLRIAGEKRRAVLEEQVETSLRRAALWDEVKDRLKLSAYRLSGGQMQRLCIARAIANRPEVILMDEPCSSLDPIATGKIEDLIIELKKDYTIVIVTHNMQQASRIADRTVFMLLGHVVEADTTENIFFRPQDERTEAYITGRFG